MIMLGNNKNESLPLERGVAYDMEILETTK
jgi:hypothetical protein